MTKDIILLFTIYLIIINIVASILAIIDKRRAVKGKWRIPESTLMLIGLLGGATGEYLTMKKIHHKTKHAKFMIGLPIEIFLHIILLAVIIYKVALQV